MQQVPCLAGGVAVYVRGVARSRMRTEAGKMPVSIIFEIGNGLGESDDLFGLCVRQCQVKSIVRQGRASNIEDSGFFLHRCRA